MCIYCQLSQFYAKQAQLQPATANQFVFQGGDVKVTGALGQPVQRGLWLQSR